MYGELGSVKGIVDLSPQEALDSAEALLRGLNYRIVRRSDTSITASRSRFEGAENVATLTVAISPQLEGGVRITLRGNDHEGMRENQSQWRTWSEGLPKKPGTEIVESPNVPLPAPHQPNAPVLSGPQQVPTVAPPPREGSTVWRGTKLAFGGCIILPLLLLGGFVGCLAVVGGMGGFEGTPSSESPAEIGSVVVRVSGSPNLKYSGNYGTTESGGTTVDGGLGVAPDEYQVPVESGAFDFDMVTAFFQKLGGQGTLKVEIVVDGQVMKSQETTAQYGVVDMTYSPQLD